MTPDKATSLLFSEHALAAIPKKKFKLDSWSSLDLFMDFATELFGSSSRRIQLSLTMEKKEASASTRPMSSLCRSLRSLAVSCAGSRIWIDSPFWTQILVGGISFHFFE